MNQNMLFDGLVKTSISLSCKKDFKSFISSFLERITNYTFSDLAAFYQQNQSKSSLGSLKLLDQYGSREILEKIPSTSLLLNFLDECKEAVVQNEPDTGAFSDIFLNARMQSGIAIPINAGNAGKNCSGYLFINSLRQQHFGKRNLELVQAMASLASGFLEKSDKKLLKD